MKLYQVRDFFSGLVTPAEDLVSVDIGANGIKILEAVREKNQLRLVNLASIDVSKPIIAANMLRDPEYVAGRIKRLLEANEIEDKRIATCIPGASVFVKKVKMAKQKPADLESAVYFEAGNMVPGKIEDMMIDYHVLRQIGPDSLEVLVALVKGDVVNSFIEAFAKADLEVAVVDIDYYAIQNCYENSYPELTDKPVALLDIGTKNTIANLVKDRLSIFTGDIKMGGQTITDVLAEELDISVDEADTLKKKLAESDSKHKAQAEKIVKEQVEALATEFNRQLSLFWNASGLSEGIHKIFLSGGGALVPGLVEQINEKTGLDCELMDPFKLLELDEGFDIKQLSRLAPHMSLCVGLALRQPGDKEKFN